MALDVLSDVTSQYLLNVGRTIRFLSDKFGKTMTPEVRQYIYDPSPGYVNVLGMLTLIPAGNYPAHPL